MSAHADDAGAVCRRCGITFDVHAAMSPRCDAGDAGETCGCCGAPGDIRCHCQIEYRSGTSNETGPWDGQFCTVHKCAAEPR